MKTRTISPADPRLAAALALVTLAALAVVSTPAEARGCGVLKGPAHWGTPMHRPMPHSTHKMMPFGVKPGMAMTGGPSVIAVAKQSGEFATLLTAIEAGGLTGLLEGEGPYTLLAPTDAAFKKLPEGALQELLGDKDRLVSVLKYHVVPGHVTAREVLQSSELKSASGQQLSTADLSVIRADIRARNGIIHVIDKVLLPAS